MLTLKTLEYQPARDGDVLIDLSPKIAFTPSKYKTRQRAAIAFHTALVQFADAAGYTGKNVLLWTPEQSVQKRGSAEWMVCWEEGPFEWATNMSAQLHHHPHWFTEPYYSFDLCFTH